MSSILTEKYETKRKRDIQHMKGKHGFYIPYDHKKRWLRQLTVTKQTVPKLARSSLY